MDDGYLELDIVNRSAPSSHSLHIKLLLIGFHIRQMGVPLRRAGSVKSD